MDNLADWLTCNLPSNYRLESECGSGGMGSVFRVFHLDWEVSLAVKIPTNIVDQRDMQQFLDEAQIWAEIGIHPYVSTFHYIRQFDSRYCIFSEFVEHGGLDTALRSKRHCGPDEEATLSRILTLAASTAWGLYSAHRAGLIHCDFKPGNALLEPDFTAKVTDFGIAQRNIPGSVVFSGLSEPYASPEQIRKSEITAATDYWSWAATVFELFIGERSWQSGAAVGAAFEDFVADGAKHPEFPRIPERLINILKSCLAYPPSDRPDSFGNIAKILCELHSELLDEPCPASEPDLSLIAADSLNNRAVSLLDIGDTLRASQLLLDALKLDPLHPEALFNYYVYLNGKNVESVKIAERNLLASLKMDESSTTLPLLLSRVNMLLGREVVAKRFLNWAMKAGRQDSFLGNTCFSLNSRLLPVLAKPTSGSEYAHHNERFSRLISKAKTAMDSNDSENASRYLLMAGDIPGFGRHPDLHKLRALLNP